MKFENWFLEYLDKLNKKYQKENVRIREVFGSFSNTCIGSARHPHLLPKFSKEIFRKYIEKAHSFNIEFNYLLNPSCTGNFEYTSEFRKELLSFVEFLLQSGVDKITVSNPYLLELLKKHYPDLKIIASVICEIDSVEKAIFYQNLGAVRLVLDYSINRDFPALKKIREKISIELELILNDTCILRCPVRHFHYNFISHLKEGKNVFDYFLESCSLKKLKDPSLFIKSPWIRPEDIKEYYSLGIDSFKIIGRERETKDLINSAEAYLSRKYSGNLMDILSFYIPEEENIEIYIDNNKLEHFIDFFKKSSCNFYCSECKYCEEIAKNVVKISQNIRKKYISLLEERINTHLLLKNLPK